MAADHDHNSRPTGNYFTHFQGLPGTTYGPAGMGGFNTGGIVSLYG